MYLNKIIEKTILQNNGKSCIVSYIHEVKWRLINSPFIFKSQEILKFPYPFFNILHKFCFFLFFYFIRAYFLPFYLRPKIGVFFSS